MFIANQITESVLFAAALLPPVCVLLFVYRLDKLEKEPVSLLIRLFFRGVIAVLPIIALELVGQMIAQSLGYSQQFQLFLLYFIIPGFVEEGVKYWTLKRNTWYEPNFDSRFDAIVYAAFISLGFAAVENVNYVLSTGLTTAIVRAVLAIPGHMAFAVIMGHYYAKAKQAELSGNPYTARKYSKRAWLYAAILHGLYDYILIAYGGWYFALYFAALIIFALKLLLTSSEKDGPIK